MTHFSERVRVIKRRISAFSVTATSSIISYGNIIFDLCVRFQEHSQGVNQGLGVMCSAHECSPRVTLSTCSTSCSQLLFVCMQHIA